jgi:hypothetical protein
VSSPTSSPLSGEEEEEDDDDDDGHGHDEDDQDLYDVGDRRGYPRCPLQEIRA